MEIALAAARSARFLELKDIPEEQRAREVKQEALAIEDGELNVRNPTPAQARMLAIEDERRSETGSEKKARLRRQFERQRRVQRDAHDERSTRQVREQQKLFAVQG